MSTITLDVYVTGGSLGTKLANEPEETFYCLKEMASDSDDSFPKEVAGYAYGEDRDNVVAFLRELADAIETES